MGRLKGDSWVAIGLLAACAVFLRDLLATDAGGAYVKATTLPIALTILLAVLSVILLGWSLRRPAARPAPPPPPDAGPEPSTGSIARRVILLVGATVLYIAALPWFGFLISTGAVIAATSVLYGNRRPVSIIGAMIVIPVVLLLFFEKYMIVLLPSARLFG